jgi:UDP-GlcNAc:undecaprenyl-phosphate GlcNAc-1-phosphate transferase
MTKFFIIYSIISFFIFLVLHSFFYHKSQSFNINKAYQKAIRWSSQSKPIAGGITFFISFIVGTIFFLSINYAQKINTEYLYISLALIIAFFTGLADDLLFISPWLKLFMQTVASVLLVYSGLYIKVFPYFSINVFVSIIWYIGLMNSINMLDNMDSVVSTVSTIFLLAFLYLSILNNDVYESYIIISLIMALFSFLFYNFPPAKMYMGDNGSLFLGLFLAILGVKYIFNSNFSYQHYDIFTYLIPFYSIFLFFIVPISDTTTVIINRILQNRSPFQGGKDHTTHALFYLGFNELWINIILAFFSLVGVALSIYLILTNYSSRVLLSISIFYSIFVFLFLYINAYIQHFKK